MKLPRTLLLALLVGALAAVAPAVAQAALRLGIVEVKGMTCSG